MRGISRVALIVVCAFCTAMLLPARAQNVQAGSSEAKAEPVQFLLEKVKEIADQGALFEPDKVARIMDLRFQQVTAENIKQPPDCSAEVAFRSFMNTTITVDGQSWYRPLPTGAGNMPVGGMFVPPGAKTGDAKFGYHVSHAQKCTDVLGLLDETTATMDLSGLPSYACVKVADIKKAMPAATYAMGTDGMSAVHYRGLLNDDSATTVTFDLNWGNSCALGIRIEQNRTHGLRFQRALAKYEQCARPAEQQFCHAHAPFGWGDGQTQNEMLRYANKVCGTQNTLYLREPLTGKKPVDLPPLARRKTPCG